MTLIELFAPKGTLSEAQRRYLGEKLITELIHADGAPGDLIARGRAMAWLVIHEPETWTVGGRPVSPGEPPRYLVRVSVPGGHLNDGMRAELVARVTRVLADVDDDAGRLYQEPAAVVQILEIPDGSIGAFGRIVTTGDIVKLTVDADYRTALTARSGGDTAGAALIDPICGMTVPLTGDALTLESEGTTYAFCNATCRDIFADRLGGR